MINILLGKINLNKVKTLINGLEFKGRTRTEKNSYLDYMTQEYKESSTELTDLFGDIDQDIINFLDGLYTKYGEITESNHKQFIQEINIFSDNYKYKINDIRKNKEELIKAMA